MTGAATAADAAEVTGAVAEVAADVTGARTPPRLPVTGPSVPVTVPERVLGPEPGPEPVLAAADAAEVTVPRPR